jgi:dUTP pyrophosphatase
MASLPFKFARTLPDAVAPSKAHPDDSGYDLVLVSKIKEENGVGMYDTGIIVQPPPGFYFEVYGRSSISKTGYMLANNVGIIDQGYRGSIRVALVKVNPEAPELQLPVRLAQMIPRRFEHLEAEEVAPGDLNETLRGSGGFGSTTR